MNKERIDRIKECKRLVVKLPLETAIQLETTENELSLVKKEVERLQQFERKAIYTMEENARLRIYEKQIQKLQAAATRVENEETDSFEFGEEVLGILGRLM